MKVEYRNRTGFYRNSIADQQLSKERRAKQREEEREEGRLRELFSEKPYASLILEKTGGILGVAEIKLFLELEEVIRRNGEIPGGYWKQFKEKASMMLPEGIVNALFGKEKIEEEATFKIPAVFLEIEDSQYPDLGEFIEKTARGVTKDRGNTLFQILREVEIRIKEVEAEKCFCFTCELSWETHFTGKMEIGRDKEGKLHFFYPDININLDNRGKKSVRCPNRGKETFPLFLPQPENEEYSWLPEFLKGQFSQIAAFLPAALFLEILQNLSRTHPF